jgi:hypothetical protein
MESLGNDRNPNRNPCSPKGPLLTEIPKSIMEQEGEIEAIFRHLLRFGRRRPLHDSEYRTDDNREQEIASWILVAALGFVSVVGLYLLSAQD